MFTGGLEARLLRPWHVELLRRAKARRMYFAYDTPDDYEPLVEAVRSDAPELQEKKMRLARETEKVIEKQVRQRQRSHTTKKQRKEGDR